MKIFQKINNKTFLGSAELAKFSEKDFEELKKEVTSPNGTTEAGLKTMTEKQSRECYYIRN